MWEDASQDRGPSPARQGAAFVLPAAVLIYYALRGGSYDIVIRQEEAVVLWWVLGLGFGLGILPRARWWRGALIPLAAAGLLAVWTAIALGWTESDERTVAELARVLHYGGIVLLVWSLIDRSVRRPAAAGVLVGALTVCALALGSRLFPGPFPEDHVARVFEGNRLNYPFNYWNALAAWGAMSFAMALAWSAHAANAATRAACLALLPVCGLTVYLTYSRGGLIATAAGAALVVALAKNRWLASTHALVGAAGAVFAMLVTHSQPEVAHGSGTEGVVGVLLALAGTAALCAVVAILTRESALERMRLSRRASLSAVAAGLVALVVALAVVWQGPASDAWSDFKELTPQEERGRPETRLDDFSGSGRYQIWVGALKAFKRHPVEGLGPGSFEFWWSRTTPLGTFERDAHSLYLEQAAEAGIAALLLTVAFLFGVGALALRGLANSDRGVSAALLAAFAVFVAYAGIDWLWESTAVAVLGLMAGTVASATGPVVSRPAARSVRVAVAVLALAAVAVQLPGLTSTSQIRRSQEAFRDNSQDDAFARAIDAVDTQPWAASPHVQLGLVAESSGRLRLARTELTRATELEPTNWRHRILLARIEAEGGRPRRALAELREAKRLRPRSAFLSPSLVPGGG